jgi:hypothetical protein
MSTTSVALRLLRGAAAGTLATLPMSAVMLGAGRLGRMGEQPPEAITKEAVEDLTCHEPHGATSDVLASLAHLGFGAVSGAVFGLLPRPERVPAPLAGVAFALPVWAASYRGWVPRFGAMPHADHDRKDRVVTMIGAHVVFGAVLGALDARWSR